MNYTIVLAARNQLANTNYNSQLLPVHGKSIISWVVDGGVSKGTKSCIVLDRKNLQTQSFLKSRYPRLQQLLISQEDDIEQYGCFSILNSLLCALNRIPDSCESLRVVLGDSLCRNWSEDHPDAIVVSSQFLSSEPWCLVEPDLQGFAKKFFDKQKDLDIHGKKALAGYYQFSHVKLLRQITRTLVFAKKDQLSAVLAEYGKLYPLYCAEAGQWFDFGHRAGILQAQNGLFSSRDFNQLNPNVIRGTVCKCSEKKQKLADEFFWYRNLPASLQILTPRVASFSEDDKTAKLEMELYGYPPLSELFVWGNLDFEEWELIIRRLFEVHQLFRQEPGKIKPGDLWELYYHKTIQRLKDLCGQNSYWDGLYKHPELVIDGKCYANISFYVQRLEPVVERLLQNCKVSIVHGDYCFSNILFDTNLFVCKLIDPRGRLKEQTIYGDPRYDIAKLRHSVVGEYDFAVHGLFELKSSGAEFEIIHGYSNFQGRLHVFFDQLLEEFHYNLDEIRLIEALLFTSMIPLHKDNMERQKLFYLKAVQKLNECGRLFS